MGKTYSTVKGHFKRLIEYVCVKQIKGLIVLVVPTRALMNDVLNKYPNETEALCDADLLYPNVESDKVKICCFGKLANLIAKGEKLYAPGLLILDECDLLASWAVCFDGYAQTWDWIASNRPQMKFIGLTATPWFLTNYVSECSGFKFVDITSNSKPNYLATNAKMAKNTHVETLICNAEPSENNKVLVYVQSAKKADELASKFGHCAFIVSTSNDDPSNVNGEPICRNMSEHKYLAPSGDGAFQSEYSILEYVTKFHKLPDEICILIINDAASTGINIEDDKVKTVICKSIDLATIHQVKGRVRHDIEHLHLTYSDADTVMLSKVNEDASKYFKFGELPDGYDERFIDWGYDDNRKGDIIHYFNSDNELVENVFTKAMCKYRYEVCRSLWDNPHAYFDNLKYESKDTFIHWLNDAEKEDMRVNARRFKDVVPIDWLSVFGLSDGVSQKYLTGMEMNSALKDVHIRDPYCHDYGRTTMVKEANRIGQVSIVQDAKKKRRIGQDGIQHNTKWYCVSML